MQLGPYRLIDRLGAGGMGEVWRAEDTRLLRPAAVKILSEKIASHPDWKARFLREARTAASLNHPNIATIYAVDEQESTMYIAMELVQGTSLSDLIAARSMTPADIVRISRQTAEALAAAHEKQIVHRDIKPDNLIVLQRTVKVLDFGIAKIIGPSADDSLTRGQLILGTPYYMSPEQALGKKIDTRTDIFSLGVVMFEALTGQRPFQGSNVTETVLQILTKATPDLKELASTASPSFLAIVEKCLQKQPADRYSADELAEALAQLPDAASSRLPTREQAIPTMALPGPRAASTPMRPAAAPAPTPVQPPPSPPPPPPVAQRHAEPDAGRGVRRALVTDDDAVTRQILCSVLRQKGVPYDEANNGAEAIKQLKKQEYGIIFLDLLMPRIDGWGVLDFMRSKGLGGETKIYIMTAFREQRLSVADQEIVDGMIYKPIDENEIDRVLQKAAAARAS
ncbi:MAG TPA: protein kinase [Thermoanaerobaculia bacterium]|nr:protein kinase [Thermoanaerobaculia bacterium]